MFRLKAEHAGLEDAAAYDAAGLGVDAPFPFEREVQAEIEQASRESTAALARAQQVADHIEADKHADRDRKDTRAGDCRSGADRAGRRRREVEATLTGTGPFADPDRVGEAWAVILSRTALLPTLIAGLELGLNFAVLQGFNLPADETWSLAVVFGAVGVLAPFAAGARARGLRGAGSWAGRWARWALPVAVMAGLFLVQAMLAGLRTGFLAAPPADLPTSAPNDSVLSTLGVSPVWLLLGWWAVQAVLSLVVAWHAERTHNPFVWAHWVASRRERRAAAALTIAVAEATQAELVAAAATQDRERVAQMFAAQQERYLSLAVQAVEIYGRAMARAKNDPAFTSAMEVRLDRRRGQFERGTSRLGRVA